MHLFPIVYLLFAARFPGKGTLNLYGTVSNLERLIGNDSYALSSPGREAVSRYGHSDFFPYSEDHFMSSHSKTFNKRSDTDVQIFGTNNENTAKHSVAARRTTLNINPSEMMTMAVSSDERRLKRKGIREVSETHFKATKKEPQIKDLLIKDLSHRYFSSRYVKDFDEISILPGCCSEQITSKVLHKIDLNQYAGKTYIYIYITIYS